jgi:hypothetical protein
MEVVSDQSLTLSSSQRRRLDAYLGNVRAGYPKILYTPFFPKDWRDKALQYGQKIFEQYGRTKFELLNAIEEKEATKFGPFSVRLPYDERIDSVKSYFTKRQYSLELDRLLRAGDAISNKFRLRNVALESTETSYASLPRSTNLGLPEFSSHDEFRDAYLVRAKALEKDGYKDLSALYPCVLGWRGQPNGSQTHIKNRVVWMFDHLETIVGLRVQIPLLRQLRDRPEFAAWNDLTTVDKVITNILDSASHPVISVDFSTFDQTVPEELIRVVFNVLRSWFNKRSWAVLDWLEESFLRVGLVTPAGIWTGRHYGVPSGSALTNLIDSLSQLVLWQYVSDILELDLKKVTVLGDDGVLSFGRSFDMRVISELVLNHFGMVVSSDKGGVSTESVQFLQRLHQKRYRSRGLCVGVRSLTRTWNGACHLEHFTPGLPKAFFSCRVIMQLENAKWHPNFRNIVRLAYQSDELLREFDASEIFRMAGGIDYVEDAMRLKSYRFTNELPSHGLQQFETVKELSKLRGNRPAMVP